MASTPENPLFIQRYSGESILFARLALALNLTHPPTYTAVHETEAARERHARAQLLRHDQEGHHERPARIARAVIALVQADETKTQQYGYAFVTQERAHARGTGLLAICGLFTDSQGLAKVGYSDHQVHQAMVATLLSGYPLEIPFGDPLNAYNIATEGAKMSYDPTTRNNVYVPPETVGEALAGLYAPDEVPLPYTMRGFFPGA